MYELTTKEGYKITAELKETIDGLKWFDLEGFELNSDCFIWCDKL